jgi:hypothetical protein
MSKKKYRQQKKKSFPLIVNKTFAIKVTNTGDGLLRFKEKPYIQVLEGC